MLGRGVQTDVRQPVHRLDDLPGPAVLGALDAEAGARVVEQRLEALQRLGFGAGLVILAADDEHLSVSARLRAGVVVRFVGVPIEPSRDRAGLRVRRWRRCDTPAAS